jgi:hypothetical protein
MLKGSLRKRWIYALIAMVVSLLVTRVALAGYFEMNTTDHQRDPNWAGQGALLTDGPAEPDGYDIGSVWMSRTDPSANGTQFFNFNIQVISNVPLPSDLAVYALLSCDNDSDFTETDDRLIEYEYETNNTWIFSGDNDYLDNDATWGEGVSWTSNGTQYGPEFKVSAEDLGNCATAGQIQVTFEAWKGATPLDTTDIRTFNMTSAVTLKDFRGHSGSEDPAVLPLAAALAMVLLGSRLLLIEKKS